MTYLEIQVFGDWHPDSLMNLLSDLLGHVSQGDPFSIVMKYIERKTGPSNHFQPVALER